MRENKNIFWHDICYANLAERLVQDLLKLPFWQSGRAICHFGSCLVCRYGMVEPCGLGGTTLTPPFRGEREVQNHSRRNHSIRQGIR